MYKLLTGHHRISLFAAAYLVRAALVLIVMGSGISILEWNADSWEFLGMTHAINQGDWGFYMFGLRTPGYPMLLSAFSQGFDLALPQMTAWIPFQVALTSLSVVLSADIVARLTKNRIWAIAAGLLLVFDPLVLSGDVALISETLFNPALVGAQWLVLRWLTNRRIRDFFGAALLLQVAVLTRPSAQFFIVIVLAVILLYDRRLWRWTILLAFLFLLPIAVWTARNIAFNDIPSYSTAGIYNLLFYKNVSTDSLVTGRSPDEIVWAYALEVETLAGDASRLDRRYFPVGNYDYLYVADAARYQAMNRLAIDKFLEFHVWHVVKMPYHLLQLFSESRTMSLFIPLTVQRGIAVVMLTLFTIGGLQWLTTRRPAWQKWLVIGVPFYFIATSLVLLALPEMRYMSQFGTYWALLVVGGAGWLIQRLRKMRAAPYRRVARVDAA